MNRKEHLKSDLEKITKSIHTFLQSFEYCYYLNFPKHEERLNEKHLSYITRSGFFSFARYTFWRVTVIELHKLLNDNKETEKYNIHHLIRKLKKGGIYQSLNINKSKIDEWESDLKNQKQSINEVRKLRFKLYAHTDHDYKNVIDNSELTLKETEKLISVVTKIVFDIYFIVFDTHYEFQPIHKKETVEKIIDNIYLNENWIERKLLKILERIPNNTNYSQHRIFAIAAIQLKERLYKPGIIKLNRTNPYLHYRN